MKRVIVNAYQAGLLFKNGAYSRMLRAGAYWLWPSETVKVFDLAAPFVAPVELNVLLQDEAIKDALHVIEVKDDELALVYISGVLSSVLTAGRYAYWKGLVEYDFIKADLGKIEITENISRASLSNRLLAPYVRSYTVENYETALLFVDGKYVQTLEPGVYFWWKNNITIHLGKSDSRRQQAEINGQEILTKDKAALRVNAYAQYQVTDTRLALLENKEYERQLYVNFQLALREFIGTMTFDELLEKKETITPFILEAVRTNAQRLGVEVTGFGIRDIILPGDVKEIMNQVLVAEKKAQANIIMRREETASTRSLLNTAKLMEDNQMLFRLKEMEYVEKIADKISNITVGSNGVLIDQLKQILTRSGPGFIDGKDG
jgi:regulator of protease activity HflC (stomatin/prohibitin superfamily)